MAQDEGSKEDKFDFTSEGEAFGYISLEQARVVAMQAARDEPGEYGRRYSGARMVFEVAEQEEGEDYYVVTMSFRPAGDFRGTPGQEQFFIEKEGAIAVRQVLSLPGSGRRFPILPAAVGVLLVGIIAAVAAVFALGGSSRRYGAGPISRADSSSRGSPAGGPY